MTTGGPPRADGTSRRACSALLLVMAAAVLVVHAAQLLVLAVTGGPARVDVFAATAAPWAVTALWAAVGLRRSGTGPAAATALLAVGAVSIAVDGALEGSPGQSVLCSAGLVSIALGIGLVGFRQTTVVAGPVVLVSQVVLVLATEGTSASSWFVAVTTAALTGGLLTVATLKQQRREAVLQELAVLTRVDPLTGLLNRRGMAEGFPGLRAGAGRRQRVAVVALDLDHFKAVNDTLGHDVGDQALVAVADLLRAQSRSGDLVVRLGGEELAWIGAWDDTGAASAAAERVRRAVSEAAMPSGLHLTLSAGVAFSTVATHELPHTEALSRLLVRADEALYQAKADGRDRVAVSTPSPDAAPAAAAPAAAAPTGAGRRRHAGAPAPR